MRQAFRERREHLHRGLRTPRLTTMFMMLAILGLIFYQLRNPNLWRMFGSDDDEFMEAARAARTPAGWEREAEGENFAGTLSAEDGVRILDRIRTLEEKARDIVGEISALKTYFLH